MSLYTDTGYEVVRGIINPGAADILTRHMERHFPGQPYVPMAHAQPKARWVKSMMRVRGIVTKARECVGGEPVAISSEYFFGKPGTIGFNPHQDNHFIGTTSGHMVSCWIALTDVNADNGCLYLWPGSHKLGLLPIARETPENRVNECQRPEGPHYTIPMQKGDAIFMSGELVHGSHNHSSVRTRESLTIAYIRKGSTFRPGKYGRVEIKVA